MMTQPLLLLIYLALGILILIWSLIAGSLLYRKWRQKKIKRIEMTFADLVSRHLYDAAAAQEVTFLQIQRIFRKIGINDSNPNNVQFLIDLMIRTQRSLLGKNNDRIKLLYDQIPPYKASYRKTLNKDWYIKARGIRELYEMNQSQYTVHVAKFKNDSNVFVRREAQIALVVFLGWESLRFLPYLTRKIELWQQIKIVEKLHDLYSEPKVEYLKKIYDVQNEHGRQLVMRIIRKYHLQEEADYIISQLSHKSFELRETAIYCLSSFTLNEIQLEQVKNIFPELENLQQQKQVLKQIVASSQTDDVPFYLKILNSSHDMLKLNVAEILWNKGYVEEVQQFYLDQYKSDVALSSK